MATKIQDSLSPTPRHIAFNPEPEMFDDRLTAPERELWRRLQHQINMIWLNFQDVHNAVSRAGGVVVAKQRIEIVAGDLVTIQSASDGLVTLSDTPFAFDWMDTRRFCKCVVSPGHGVPYYEVYFDKAMQTGRNDVPMSVWGASEDTLQLIQWSGTVWTAMPWIVGWTVDLIQYIPAGLPPIVEY